LEVSICIFRMLGMSIDVYYHSSDGGIRPSGSAVVWKMAPICTFWCLWLERNNRSFEDLERTLEETLSLF
jgi:hypothetical protein